MTVKETKEIERVLIASKVQQAFTKQEKVILDMHQVTYTYTEVYTLLLTVEWELIHTLTD